MKKIIERTSIIGIILLACGKLFDVNILSYIGIAMLLICLIYDIIHWREQKLFLLIISLLLLALIIGIIVV